MFPKRCGHLEGKTIVPPEQFAERISRVSECRNAYLNPDFVVCARTDARATEGFDAAVSRARLYLDAGADMIFPEALTSVEEFRAFAQALGRGLPPQEAGGRPGLTSASHSAGEPANTQGPLLVANMTEFGKSPLVPASELHAMGYDMVLYPVTVFRAAMRAAKAALVTLRDSGDNRALENCIMSREEMYDTLDYDPAQPWLYPRPKPLRNVDGPLKPA